MTRDDRIVWPARMRETRPWFAPIASAICSRVIPRDLQIRAARSCRDFRSSPAIARLYDWHRSLQSDDSNRPISRGRLPRGRRPPRT